MPENKGWIKLYRKLIDWEWYKDPKMVHLLIHLLLMANHEPHKWEGITVQRGQVVTGLSSLQKATGIPIQGLRTCLSRLENTGELTSKSTNRFRIITICNYSTYQVTDLEDNNQLTNKQKLLQLNSQYELIANLAENYSIVAFENLSKINKQINKQENVVSADQLRLYKKKISDANKQTNKQLTSKQQATNKQLTANKNVKNDKNDKNEKKKESNFLFEKFWQAYPNKKARAECLRVWNSPTGKFGQILDGQKPDEKLVDIMIEAINWQKQTDGWKKDKGKFIPHPTTWLNQGRWMDKPPELPKRKKLSEMGLDDDIQAEAKEVFG